MKENEKKQKRESLRDQNLMNLDQEQVNREHAKLFKNHSEIEYSIELNEGNSISFGSSKVINPEFLVKTTLRLESRVKDLEDLNVALLRADERRMDNYYQMRDVLEYLYVNSQLTKLGEYHIPHSMATPGTKVYELFELFRKGEL